MSIIVTRLIIPGTREDALAIIEMYVNILGDIQWIDNNKQQNNRLIIEKDY